MRPANSIPSALILSLGLFVVACGNPTQGEDKALVANDDQQAPGNDDGLLKDNRLNQEGGATTVGGVNSYTGADDRDDGTYDATVGGTEDNPSFSQTATNGNNDPVTPNAPLADGTAGQPGQAVRNTNSARNQNAADTPNDGRSNDGDRPYGSNMSGGTAENEANRVDSQEDLKSYVSAEGATNMPVYTKGQDPAAYVGSVYGGSSDSPRNTAPVTTEEDVYQVSLYAPAMSDVAAASYTNTQSKLFAKPGAQNYKTYQPIQLEFIPLLSWHAPAPERMPADKAARVNSAPKFGTDCDNASDVVGCSSGSFSAELMPILNDPRVAQGIANDRIDGLRFELDNTGKVKANTLEVLSDGQRCTAGACARFRSLVAGVINQQTWSPSLKDGVAVATRVHVPLRASGGLNKNLIE